jgi:flagellar hook assembly protein FlgD
LKIDLYTTKDKLVTNIYNGKIQSGFYTMEWDGKDPAGKNKLKGDYKVRWTINGGCREFPVVIK